MVEIPIKQTEFHEDPKEFTVDNVQFYSRHTKLLAKTQVSKALKFVRNDCIKYLGKDLLPVLEQHKLADKYKGAKHVFICLPLNTKTSHEFLGISLEKTPYQKDYNSSEYILYKRDDGIWECNCQFWQTKARKGEITDGVNCSHVLSLFYSFRLKRFNNVSVQE